WTQNRDRPWAGRCVELVPILDAEASPADFRTEKGATLQTGRRISQVRTGDAEQAPPEYWTLCWCCRNCHRRSDPLEMLDAEPGPAEAWTENCIPPNCHRRSEKRGTAYAVPRAATFLSAADLLGTGPRFCLWLAGIAGVPVQPGLQTGRAGGGQVARCGGMPSWVAVYGAVVGVGVRMYGPWSHLADFDRQGGFWVGFDMPNV
ncbi:hypothetical protein SAMN02745119_03206, partial [Trichlorobacter thiogenes]